ncbi:unnamed protein product [Gongylonema pulchrum]|uniref:Uncharacterized protein n=1 Tax=Gongylonema pulchrum TaxID=637853 RepID=A0A183E2A2_9BILA|nr:unnamed protein product [Gongylonema pulchrum]
MPSEVGNGELLVTSIGINNDSSIGRAEVATSSGAAVRAESASLGCPESADRLQSRRRLTFPMDRPWQLRTTLERHCSIVAINAGNLERHMSVVAKQTSARARNAFVRFISYKQVYLFLLKVM